MNAAYRDQSMKVTVHFAPCEDGGLMVWSERWRGLTQSSSVYRRSCGSRHLR